MIFPNKNKDIYIKKQKMKNSEQYLKKLLRKTINETLEEKTNKLMGKIKEYEMGEGFDSPEIKFDRQGKDYDKYEFKGRVRSRDFIDDIEDDSITEPELKLRTQIKDIDLDDLYDDDYGDPYIEGDEEPLMEGEMCEQCGGRMNEGECMECWGNKMEEGIYDVAKKFPKKQSFDYIEEEEEEDISDDDILNDYCYGEKADEERCAYHKKIKKDEVNERLYGNQRKLDRNKNNKIDSDDFKLLRKNKNKSEVEEEEMGEGNKFTGMLAKARKGDKFSMNGKTYTDTSDYDVNENIEYRIKDNNGDFIELNENELINFIENIVNEQKTKLKVIDKHKGLSTYEKAHKESGRENEEYFKSLNKKMKDYLKDGSKGKFDMNPKMFPQGNGELAKMDKKAFKMTDDLEDFNYEIGGQNFPVPDAIDYNEDWMEKLFKGDSMTGNAPGGNALDSKANERFNKMRKKNTLKKLKDQSYKRVPQPVFNEKPGSESGKGLNIKLESIETKKVEKLNEEFGRIKNLFSYNRKTQ
jgi:hypothetical protein